VGVTYCLLPLSPDLFREHLGTSASAVAASSVGTSHLERQYGERLRSRRFEIESGALDERTEMPVRGRRLGGSVGGIFANGGAGLVETVSWGNIARVGASMHEGRDTGRPCVPRYTQLGRDLSGRGRADQHARHCKVSPVQTLATGDSNGS
jgi:hypothetical protein